MASCFRRNNSSLFVRATNWRGRRPHACRRHHMEIHSILTNMPALQISRKNHRGPEKCRLGHVWSLEYIDRVGNLVESNASPISCALLFTRFRYAGIGAGVHGRDGDNKTASATAAVVSVSVLVSVLRSRVRT
jgi:hypothetical protein